LGDEDVGGFYIAMNDPRRMSGIERVGDLNTKRQEQIGFKWTPRNTVLKRHTIEKLHGDERLPVLLADAVNRADVGVIEGRRGLSFALKTGERLRIACNILRQELEGDETG